MTGEVGGFVVGLIFGFIFGFVLRRHRHIDLMFWLKSDDTPGKEDED